MKYIYALLVLLVVLASSCKDPCDDISCNGNGDCIDGTCFCDDGFEGVNCEKDLCANVDCNDGTCLNGTCQCDDGFEGENCEFRERDKFIGTWNGDIDCGDLIDPGETAIVITADANNVENVEFALDFELLDLDPVIGTVVGTKVFIISSIQTLDFMGFPATVTISGQGDYNDDDTVTMSISLVSALPPLEIDCVGVLSPQ